MNTDHMKGAAEKLAGKVQEKTGALLGNKQQAKGLAHQVEGAARQKMGQAGQGAKDLITGASSKVGRTSNA